MAKITSSKFWFDLLGKIVKILLKRSGLSPRSGHNQHVVPHEDGWAVRGEGNERVTAVFDRQSQAIDRAREIAENYRSSVIIHGRDGQIRDRMSYK